MTNENRRYLSLWYLRINDVFPESVSMSRRRGWIIADGIDVNIGEQNCTINVSSDSYYYRSSNRVKFYFYYKCKQK